MSLGNLDDAIRMGYPPLAPVCNIRGFISIYHQRDVLDMSCEVSQALDYLLMTRPWCIFPPAHYPQCAKIHFFFVHLVSMSL